MKNKRKQALSILIRMRDVLSDRLAEFVLEEEEQLMIDAEGSSYTEEINTLYERVGGKLNQVNTMIGNLPVADPPTTTSEPTAKDESGPTDSLNSAGPSNSGDPSNSIAPTSETRQPVSPPVNFALFGRQIAASDIEGAGKTLSEILGIDEESGHRCAVSFQKRLQEDPATIEKTMSLRQELAAGNNNNSLEIILECFGLQGMQAVQVLEKLKTI